VEAASRGISCSVMVYLAIESLEESINHGKWTNTLYVFGSTHESFHMSKPEINQRVRVSNNREHDWNHKVASLNIAPPFPQLRRE
jgi:hypothetical protein